LLEIDRYLTRPSQRVGHAHLRAMAMNTASRSTAAGRGERKITRISTTHRQVFRRCRAERFDHFRRIGCRDRAVECRDDIHRLWGQIFVVVALVHRHRASRQGVGIGKKCIGKQQLTLDRRYCLRTPGENRAVKADGIETLITGAENCARQRCNRSGMTIPYRLVPMHGVKATQQTLVHPLARHRHSTRRVEPVFKFGISDERGERRRPEVVNGCG
jgi:hypothetical protein